MMGRAPGPRRSGSVCPPIAPFQTNGPYLAFVPPHPLAPSSPLAAVGAEEVRGDKAVSGSPPGFPPPRRWVPIRSSPATPTPPALRAPPLPPHRGRGRSWRYPVGSRARGAVLTPVSRGKGGVGPNPVPPRDLPVQWTVGVSPGGGGVCRPPCRANPWVFAARNAGFPRIPVLNIPRVIPGPRGSRDTVPCRIARVPVCRPGGWPCTTTARFISVIRVVRA